MGGMYPNNQDIEIFGEQVSWPGVDASGKFTNGSFTDPMVKPSFIPAETVNLILDNLSALIEKCGGVPNATGGGQLAGIASYLAEAQKIVRRDGAGRAKVAAPSEPDDIARLAEVSAAVERLRELEHAVAHMQEPDYSATPNGYGMYKNGRDLFGVLGVSTITDAMQALSERCNGEGVADFRGLQIGDYIDGLDLSGIPAEGGGDAGQPWNDGYKNNRIVISGLNTYKGIGDTENRRNHVMFTFRNIPLRKRMNPTNTSAGGYPSSELRAFLEGANGNGTGGLTGVTSAAFLNVLRNQIGDRILTLRLARDSAWNNYTLFPPSELEVVGSPNYGTDGRERWNTNIHLPIFSHSSFYRIKRYNGVRSWWWLSSPAASAGVFAGINYNGISTNGIASSLGGCAPAFCVA